MAEANPAAMLILARSWRREQLNLKTAVGTTYLVERVQG